MDLENYGVGAEFWNRMVVVVDGNPFGIDFVGKGRYCDHQFDLLQRVVDDHGIVVFLHHLGHRNNLRTGHSPESFDDLFLFQRQVLLRGRNVVVHGRIPDIGRYVVLYRAINRDLNVKQRWMETGIQSTERWSSRMKT